MSAICPDDMDENFKYKSTEKPVVNKDTITTTPDAPQHDNLISTKKGANDELLLPQVHNVPRELEVSDIGMEQELPSSQEGPSTTANAIWHLE